MGNVIIMLRDAIASAEETVDVAVRDAFFAKRIMDVVINIYRRRRNDLFSVTPPLSFFFIYFF